MKKHVWLYNGECGVVLTDKPIECGGKKIKKLPRRQEALNWIREQGIDVLHSRT